MTLIRSRLQGRELKPFICVQVHVQHMKEMHTCVFCMCLHSMNHTYAYSRDDRKIKFRMVSAQHFINEAPEVFICNNEDLGLCNIQTSIELRLDHFHLA